VNFDMAVDVDDEADSDTDSESADVVVCIMLLWLQFSSMRCDSLRFDLFCTTFKSFKFVV